MSGENVDIDPPPPPEVPETDWSDPEEAGQSGFTDLQMFGALAVLVFLSGFLQEG